MMNIVVSVPFCCQGTVDAFQGKDGGEIKIVAFKGIY